MYNIETAFINKPEVIEPQIPEVLDFEPVNVGGDPSTWGPETTPEVLDFEPVNVGDDPSTWAPETTPEVIDLEPAPEMIMGGNPSTWAPETTS